MEVYHDFNLLLHQLFIGVYAGGGTMKWKTNWINEDDQYLNENYASEDWDVMIRHLGRTKDSIRARAHILGLTRESQQYALYKGDNLLGMGTVEDLAKKENVKQSTIRYYLSSSYRRRSDGIKTPVNRRVLVRL